MAMKPVPFGGVSLGVSATTVGTVTGNTRWIVQKCALSNYGGSPSVVSLWLVPSGGTPGDNYLIESATLQAGETWSSPAIERLVALAGATIQGSATPATVNASGAALEVT